MDEHDMLGTGSDNSPPDSPIRSSTLVISPPKSRKRTHRRRNPGEKVVLRLDAYNRPVSPKDDVIDLSRHACKFARREIPLIYSDFRDVPPEHYERIIKGLNEHYVFENCEEDGVDCEYIRDKVKDAWKGFKSTLKRKRIDGKDPASVKLEDAPKGHPVEDWRMFIDNCNTEEMQRRSAQNSENRAGCKFPNCSGRIPAQVVRHEIAKEKGVPDSQVGLGHLYREMHTKKKDKALQNSGDADGGDCNIEDGGDFSKGRLNAIGAGVSKTLVKKMIPIVKRHENEELSSKKWKNKMEGKIDGLVTVVSQFVKSVDANHSQSPSMTLSGHPYDVGATSLYTQRPSMLPSGQDRVVGASPLNNTRRTSMPPGEHHSDVDASLTTPIPLSGHRDGNSSPKFGTQRRSLPPSGRCRDVSASMAKSVPLSGNYSDVDSPPKSNTEKTSMPSSGQRRDCSSSVNNTQKTSMPRSEHHYDVGTSVRNPVPLSGHHIDGDSSLKNNIERTSMPPSGHRYGSSLANSTQKTSMPPSGHLYELDNSVKAPKTSMLLSGHHHDGGSSPANSTPLPPLLSKEHHHEVSASLVNNSKRTMMLPSGQLHNVTTISKGLPKIVTGDIRRIIGAKVKVRGGWPSKVLAMGAIKAVDPRAEFEGRKLGVGNYLIYVDSVLCPNFQLPQPLGERTTLGQVQGHHVIWPKDDIKLMDLS